MVGAHRAVGEGVAVNEELLRVPWPRYDRSGEGEAACGWLGAFVSSSLSLEESLCEALAATCSCSAS